jgi:UDP-N-acetylmuramyl pentapeptide phosphotransferase/UDP-N-acetylglucosamine-1-phosphate transferase
MIYGITVLFSFLFLKLFSFIKTPLLSDIPNERSMHSSPVKRSAGIVFFSLFWGITSIYSLEKDDFNPDFYFIISCTLFFSLLGFLDDIKNLSSKLKLILEIIFIFIILLIYPNSFSLFSFEIPNFRLLTIFLLTLYIVFISNLCNFMDGLDLYLSITFLIFIINFTIFNNFIISNYLGFLILLLFSMSSFFYFNSPNAKMFMGDSGSLPIGFLIGISPLYSGVEGLSKDLSFILLFIPVFIIDGVFTLLKRTIEKKHIFRAHREHLYQRVQIELKWGKWKTLLVFGLLNVVPSTFYFILRESETKKLGILISLILIIFIYIRIFLLCSKKVRVD